MYRVSQHVLDKETFNFEDFIDVKNQSDEFITKKFDLTNFFGEKK